jgi:hypothetical protein
VFAEESVKDPGPVLMSEPALPPLTIGAEMLTAAVAALTISSFVAPIVRDSVEVGAIVSVPVPAFRMPLSFMPPVALELMVTPLPE